MPVIQDFLAAMQKVTGRKNIHAPVVTVRSDGSLMSESFAKEHPVETILSGPAASVIGGMRLAEKNDCVLVDMGGTTSDIAIVRGGVPVKVSEGVQIGKWSTFVKSVSIHTFGLGWRQPHPYRCDGPAAGWPPTRHSAVRRRLPLG